MEFDVSKDESGTTVRATVQPGSMYSSKYAIGQDKLRAYYQEFVNEIWDYIEGRNIERYLERSREEEAEQVSRMKTIKKKMMKNFVFGLLSFVLALAILLFYTPPSPEDFTSSIVFIFLGFLVIMTLIYGAEIFFGLLTYPSQVRDLRTIERRRSNLERIKTSSR